MQSAAAYGALVERLETQSRHSPRLYKFKLALLACFGFTVLGGSALLALGISAGLVIGLAMISPVLLLKLLKVLWIPVAFGWFLLKALWVRFDPPEGYRVRQSEAPDLFAEVERLRHETGAPKLEAILIDADLNAAAASVPRVSGLFGHKHYLVLGLPLMQLLGREDLLAVIAHEFGHFGGGHSRFTGWIYRVRVSWYRVLWALNESGSSLSGFYTRFFKWYAPYFNAYSFSLARANEYQADAAAARVMGASTAGQALVRVHLGSDRLERDFWPQVQRAIQTQSAPPTQLYRDMGAHLRGASEHDQARIGEALAAAAGLDDTHPTLAQRLAALGVQPGALQEPRISAAEALLGPVAAELEKQFSEEWHARVREEWERTHQEHATGAARLVELDALVEMDAAQTCEYARLVEDGRPDVDALPLYQRAVAMAPDDAHSHFRLGAILLSREDSEGVQNLRRAMELDPAASEVCTMLLTQHYEAAGDEHGLRAAEQHLDDVHAARARLQRERLRVNAKDVYQPNGLDTEQLAGLELQLRAITTVKKAWVVRKHVSDDPNELPAYVVLVAWRGMILSGESNLQKVVDALELPGSMVVITAPNQRGIARRIRKAAGTPTFVR